MTCKEKKSTLVLLQPHVQITLLQVFLVTGTSGHLGQTAFQAGAAGADIARRPTRVERASPLLPALWLPAGAFSQLSPPAQALLVRPGSSWGMQPTHPAPEAVTAGVAEKQRTRRGLPFHKGSQRHLKRKLHFPQCLIKWMGDGDPAVAPILSTKKGPSVRRIWELGANSCPLQVDPAASIWLAGPCLKSETQKACGNKQTNKHISSNVSFLVHSLCVSSHCFW